jgi:hypothetical protein
MYRTLVNICTAKWSIYVPHSGQYMYRPVVTICSAHWSLYVPHSGHYMNRTVFTMFTAQWSLYVPHSGHYSFRTVVTICTAQCHYMFHPVVTICTTSLTFNNSTFCPHTVFMCFVWISVPAASLTINNINWLVCITVTESVYPAVRTGYLYIFLFNLSAYIHYTSMKLQQPANN